MRPGNGQAGRAFYLANRRNQTMDNEKNTRNPRAESLFRDRYGYSRNLMSPRIHARRMIAAGRLAVELASGDGIFRGTEIWGVTVLLARNVHERHDLSQSFGSRAEAEAYIETLRDWREPGETIGGN
jgi:hypothetical protein